MGRAKLKMEYIMNEKSRHLTFKKRKEGLIKKIKEFTTLCDVSACMIIYGPEDCSTEPLVWPENLNEVKRIINIYRSKNKDCENNVVGLSDFLKDRSKKIEEELSKFQEFNIEANYFTSDEFMENISENQLREFSSELNGKLDVIYSKIEMMKLNIAANGYGTSLFQQPYGNNVNTHCSLVQRGIELDLMDHHHQQPIFPINPLEMQVPIHFPVVEHEFQHSFNNPNSMMMMLRNDNDNNMQFGVSSNNFQCASYTQQVYYESSQDVNNVMLYDDSAAYLKRYFAPTQQQPMLPYMQCAAVMPTIVPSVAPPVNSLQDNDGGDIDDYQPKDTTAKY